MSAQSYSILIPHVFMNISRRTVINAFEKYDIGKIKDIDCIIKKSPNGNKYKMLFIHFKYWNMKNSAAVNLREKIENPNKEARFMYDDPWYWLILPSNPKKEELSQIDIMKNSFEVQMNKLENELHYIYEELYKREFIPDLNKTPEWYSDNISILSHNYAPIYPCNKDEYQEECSISSSIETRSLIDLDNDINYDDDVYSNNYTNDDIYFQDKMSRNWMSKNICDNA